MKKRVYYNNRCGCRRLNHLKLNKVQETVSIVEGIAKSEQKQKNYVSEFISLFFLISSRQCSTKESIVDHGKDEDGAIKIHVHKG